MADEEDFSSLPLTDRWVHKLWKARKGAYEEAAHEFEKTPDEHAPAFRPFVQDASLMKSAVSDSNVAAHQEGLAALCAFLKFGSRDGAVRTRGQTVTLICEKCLASTRSATKASALEALLLYIELDVPGPVIDEMLPVLSNKVPKVVAALLAALTQIYHSYGCKTADPKPVLKILPRVFGHADKNVRAEATNLTVEFYRWLREAMKPMFWGDLKPTQQTDLEAHFEKVKAEGSPKQERLLRSQQEVVEKPPAYGSGEDDVYDDGGDGDEAGELDAFELAEPREVHSQIPASFTESLNSSKWKDRKDAVDALYTILHVPRIKDGDFSEVNRGLAKCMKDANVAVVTIAAQCIQALAKGLRQGYGRYRTIVMQPIMERLKEKKQVLADALGAALDQVFLATSLSECLEDIQVFLVHKNPQVKEGTMKFLVRCLQTTRVVPEKHEIASIVESGKKLLSESTEGLRSGGAEILGTTMKIIGERAMNPHLEGLDDIRKTKIKEFLEKAEVKAKDKPKPKPPPVPTAKGLSGGTRKAMGSGKKTSGAKKTAAAAAAKIPAPGPALEHESEALTPQLTSRAAGGKIGGPKFPGLGGLKAPQKRALSGRAASPRRGAASPEPPASPSPPHPKPLSRLGVGRGGLATRSLAKPSAAPMPPPVSTSPPPSSGLAPMERAELEELRLANNSLIKQLEEALFERFKIVSEIQELKNQNAGLIEENTRHILSIKAKDTQLRRYKTDLESAEANYDRTQRELDRLKRALSKAEAMQIVSGRGESPMLGLPGMGRVMSPTHEDGGMCRDKGDCAAGANRNHDSYASTFSDERENGESPVGPSYSRHKPTSSASGVSSGGGSGGAESWRRAAEVTSQLKARIEQMKAKQTKRF